MSLSEAGSEKTGIVPAEAVESGYVVLPFDRDQFNSFIGSLLGSPQTIGKRVKGAFEFGRGEVENIHHLLVQRISQQNHGSLMQFRAKVVYSDDSTVELNSVTELNTYNEVRPVVSRAIHLTWDFLVEFPDKQAPERQRIQLSAIASGIEAGLIDDDVPILEPLLFDRSQGYIAYRIEHTARTWGADLDALLTNHIHSIIRATSPIRDFVARNSAKIALSTAGMFFTAALVGALYRTYRFSTVLETATREKVRSLGGGIEAQIDALMEIVVAGSWPKHNVGILLYIFVSFGVAVFFLAWLESAARPVEPSFVLFSRKSFEDRDNKLLRRKRKWISFLVATVTSVVTGIVANLLFVHYFS